MSNEVEERRRIVRRTIVAVILLWIVLISAEFFFDDAITRLFNNRTFLKIGVAILLLGPLVVLPMQIWEWWRRRK